MIPDILRLCVGLGCWQLRRLFGEGPNCQKTLCPPTMENEGNLSSAGRIPLSSMRGRDRSPEKDQMHVRFKEAADEEELKLNNEVDKRFAGSNPMKRRPTAPLINNKKDGISDSDTDSANSARRTSEGQVPMKKVALTATADSSGDDSSKKGDHYLDRLADPKTKNLLQQQRSPSKKIDIVELSTAKGDDESANDRQPSKEEKQGNDGSGKEETTDDDKADNSGSGSGTEEMEVSSDEFNEKLASLDEVSRKFYHFFHVSFILFYFYSSFLN